MAWSEAYRNDDTQLLIFLWHGETGRGDEDEATGRLHIYSSAIPQDTCIISSSSPRLASRTVMLQFA